jgi:hypothetical protein
LESVTYIIGMPGGMVCAPSIKLRDSAMLISTYFFPIVEAAARSE